MADDMQTAPEIGELYDRMSELMALSHGGYQHGGYWSGPMPAATAVEAGDKLTDRVGRDLRIPSGGALLDVGCGNGRAGLRLAGQLDGSLTGITLSPYEARRAEQTAVEDPPARGARFQVADMRQMPFADESFHAAVAIESVCHLQDRTEGLAEIRRVLRPGARLALTDFVLRRPIADPIRQASVARSEQEWNQGPILPEEVYRDVVRRAGLEMLAFDDIGEAVRPSWNAVADEMLRRQDWFGQSLEEVAAQLRAFGEVDEVGYAVVLVSRPARP